MEFNINTTYSRTCQQKGVTELIFRPTYPKLDVLITDHEVMFTLFAAVFRIAIRYNVNTYPICDSPF